MPPTPTPRRTTVAPRAAAVVALVLALVALVGCGGGDGSPAGPPAPASEGRGAGPLAFTAPVLGGGQLDGGSLAGQAVLLWFWAPT